MHKKSLWAVNVWNFFDLDLGNFGLLSLTFNWWTFHGVLTLVPCKSFSGMTSPMIWHILSSELWHYPPEYSLSSCQNTNESCHLFLLPFKLFRMLCVPIQETHQLLLSPCSFLSGHYHAKIWSVDSQSPLYWLRRDHMNSIWIHFWLCHFSACCRTTLLISSATREPLLCSHIALVCFSH